MISKKKKLVLTVVAAGVLLILICVFLFVKIFNSDGEIIHTHATELHDVVLNDGRFYFNGNPDSVYYDIQNGSIGFIFNEETYKQYLTEMNYTENQINNNYSWALDFWEQPKPYKIWGLFPQVEDDNIFVSFETFDMECDNCGEMVNIPGGGYSYIDKNTFGSVGGSCGDIIFTRIE